ncbi:hypothetical protein K438DRAFT_2023515, partial [Mycena galopus ATCC 62051]
SRLSKVPLNSRVLVYILLLNKQWTLSPPSFLPSHTSLPLPLRPLCLQPSRSCPKSRPSTATATLALADPASSSELQTRLFIFLRHTTVPHHHLGHVTNDTPRTHTPTTVSLARDIPHDDLASARDILTIIHDILQLFHRQIRASQWALFLPSPHI